MSVTLGVFAHPDDEVIVAGGTLACMGGGRGSAHVRLLTNGVGGHGCDGCAVRLEEMRSAAKVLGLASVSVAEFTDQELHLVPEPQLCRIVEEWFDAIRPEYVLTHSPHDLNQDHRIVAAVVMVAARRRKFLRSIYGGEGDWPYGFTPTVFTTVDGGIGHKLAALSEYRSQERRRPDPRSEQDMFARAVYWGPRGQGMFAEAFELLWGR